MKGCYLGLKDVKEGLIHDSEVPNREDVCPGPST